MNATLSRTTRTSAYTSWGKASDVVDAAGHEFVTDFDPDGLVNSVTETDNGQNKPVVTYGYGSSGVSNGQPVSVADGLSGVVQTISYCASGGGVGMPSSVFERNGDDAYSVSYGYDARGDRETATYATPSGTARWGYYDYEWTGATASGRAFQTLCRLDASGARTAEEFHYAYDSQGRLREAAFAQSPAAGFVPAAGAPWYDKDHPASSRARAHCEYDAGGRATAVLHTWDVATGGSTGTASVDGGPAYASLALVENDCAYETSGMNRGLKTQSAFWARNDDGSYASRTEAYGYDPQLDTLTSASYGDGLPNSSQSWSYDAAGNRNDAVVDNLNRLTGTSDGFSYTSDVLGNRLTRQAPSSSSGGTSVQTPAARYGWDCLSRMTSFEPGLGHTDLAYRAAACGSPRATTRASTTSCRSRPSTPPRPPGAARWATGSRGTATTGSRSWRRAWCATTGRRSSGRGSGRGAWT